MSYMTCYYQYKTVTTHGSGLTTIMTLLLSLSACSFSLLFSLLFLFPSLSFVLFCIYVAGELIFRAKFGFLIVILAVFQIVV